MPRPVGRALPDSHRDAIRNRAIERAADARAERVEAIKEDIASGAFERRLDRLIEEGETAPISSIYRILVTVPDE